MALSDRGLHAHVQRQQSWRADGMRNLQSVVADEMAPAVRLAAIESGLGTFRGAARVLPTPMAWANWFELRVLDKDPHADAIPWPGPPVTLHDCHRCYQEVPARPDANVPGDRDCSVATAGQRGGHTGNVLNGTAGPRDLLRLLAIQRLQCEGGKAN